MSSRPLKNGLGLRLHASLTVYISCFNLCTDHARVWIVLCLSPQYASTQGGFWRIYTTSGQLKIIKINPRGGVKTITKTAN